MSLLDALRASALLKPLWVPYRWVATARLTRYRTDRLRGALRLALGRRRGEYTCPLCGYRGHFLSAGDPPVRLDARCPECQSVERHRLYGLFAARGVLALGPAQALVFAPEPCLVSLLTRRGVRVETADRHVPNVDHQVNIEATGLPTASYDLVVCNHVLEHVDDRRALSELFRLLRPGGRVLITVPLVDGWDQTFEPPADSAEERELLFGQFDHVRRYGRDFRQRLADAGFCVDELVADGEATARHALCPGERIFVCHR